MTDVQGVSMNHAKIAAEALRLRARTVQRPLLDPGSVDLDEAAACAVSSGDPNVDGAIRRLGAAWVRAGLDPAAMDRPWSEVDAQRLLDRGGADVIDALDGIARGIVAPTREGRAARPSTELAGHHLFGLAYR
jgi:hypothetical protein